MFTLTQGNNSLSYSLSVHALHVCNHDCYCNIQVCTLKHSKPGKCVISRFIVNHMIYHCTAVVQ